MPSSCVSFPPRGRDQEMVPQGPAPITAQHLFPTFRISNSAARGDGADDGGPACYINCSQSGSWQR